MRRSTRVAASTLGFLVVAAIAVMVFAHFVVGVDEPQPDEPAQQLRLEGILDSGFQVSIAVSEVFDRRVIQVGGTKIWILSDRVVLPATLLDITGTRDYLEIPLEAFGQSWRTLSTLSLAADFVLEMRECRYAGPREIQILQLFLTENDLDAMPAEVCGFGIYASEAVATRPIRVEVSTIDSTLAPPDDSVVERVRPDEVVDVVASLEDLLLQAP